MGEVISSRKFNFSILKVSVSSNERKEKEIYERGRRIVREGGEGESKWSLMAD